jgi:AraC family transcriptional regulator, positive regulator of tynA and feaB
LLRRDSCDAVSKSAGAWVPLLDDWNVIGAARILVISRRAFSASAEQCFVCIGTMRRIYSSDDLPPRERFDCWHEVICKHIIPHDSVPDCRTSFEASLDAADLADLALVCFDAGSLTVAHGRQHLESNAAELLLVRQGKGQLMLDHGGRTVALAPGEMTLVDPRQLYRGRLGQGSSFLVAKFPRRKLVDRVGKLDRFIAQRLSAQSGEVGLLSDFFSALPAHAQALSASAAQVADQLLDILAAALWKTTGGAVPRVAAHRDLHRMELRAAIEKNLTDHTATAESIARSVGIGLRYANAILNDDQTSVGRLLQARRLEQCRRALADPLKMHRSISDIAYSLGFTDMTHFGRRFRQAFGLLPSDFRKLQRAPRRLVHP